MKETVKINRNSEIFSARQSSCHTDIVSHMSALILEILQLSVLYFYITYYKIKKFTIVISWWIVSYTVNA